MPLSKCTSVDVRTYQDFNKVERLAFRLAYDEVNANKADILTGIVRTRYITAFPTTPENDIEYKTELVDKNQVPNMLVMTYEYEVKPFCRVYSQSSRNHQLGDPIIDQLTGKPKIYNTIKVDCRSRIVDGAEVPFNMSEVERQANQQRQYFSTTADPKTGLKRYYDLEEVFGTDIPAEEENEANDMPILTPTAPTTPTPPSPFAKQ